MEASETELDSDSSFFGALIRGLGRSLPVALKRSFAIFAAPLKWLRPSQIRASDVIKSRIGASSAKGMADVLREYTRRDVLSLSRRLGPILGSNTFVGVVLFSTYEESMDHMSSHFLGGAAAGFNHAIFACPFERVKNEILKHPAETQPRYIQAWRDLINRRGALSLWKGFPIAVVRDVSSFSLFFGLAFGSKSIIIDEYKLERGTFPHAIATLSGGWFGAFFAEGINNTVNSIRDIGLQKDLGMVDCYKTLSFTQRKALLGCLSPSNLLAFIPTGLGYLVFCYTQSDDNL